MVCARMRQSTLTDPLDVSTDHPICKPSPPRVNKNRNQLLFVSSSASPSQSSLPIGETILSSGSPSFDVLGRSRGDCSVIISVKGAFGEELRRKDTTLGCEAAAPSMFGCCRGGEAEEDAADAMATPAGRAAAWGSLYREVQAGWMDTRSRELDGREGKATAIWWSLR